MKMGLNLPQFFKFIPIIPPIKDLILKAIMRILLQTFPLILTNSLVLKKEFLATVADFSQVTADILQLRIDFL